MTRILCSILWHLSILTVQEVVSRYQKIRLALQIFARRKKFRQVKDLYQTHISVDRAKMANIQGLLKTFIRRIVVVGQVICRQTKLWREDGKELACNSKGFARRIKYSSARKDFPNNMVRRLSVLLVVKGPIMTCNKYPPSRTLLDVYLILS